MRHEEGKSDGCGKEARPLGPPGRGGENAECQPPPWRPGVRVQERHKGQGPRLGAEVQAAQVHGGPRSSRQVAWGGGARQPSGRRAWDALPGALEARFGQGEPGWCQRPPAQARRWPRPRPKGTLKRDMGGGDSHRDICLSAPTMRFVTRACFSCKKFPSCSQGSLRVSHK